jgi:hypothetical protein
MAEIELSPGVVFPLDPKETSGPNKGFFPMVVTNMEMTVTQEKNDTVIVNFSFEINKIDLRKANVKLDKFKIMDEPSDPVTTGYLMTKSAKKQKIDKVEGLEAFMRLTDDTQNPVDIRLNFQAAGRKIGGGAGPLTREGKPKATKNGNQKRNTSTNRNA